MKDTLQSHTMDKKVQANESGMITNTLFLDLNQRQLISSLERELSKDVKTYYYGGYEDAQRCIAVFVPSYYEIDDLDDHFLQNDDENPICAIKIVKDKFTELSHRDYLGSLMGLGIKREMIGDIIVSEKGSYIICMKSISNFIMQNLDKVGRGSVKMCEVSFDEISNQEQKIEEMFLSVSSLRLDNIIGSIFNLSRSASSEKITSGIVFVNSQQKLKNDSKVCVGDKIVLRGKGKAEIFEQAGESKKGKIRLKVKRYL